MKTYYEPLVRSFVLRVPHGVAQAPLADDDVCVLQKPQAPINIMFLVPIPVVELDGVAMIHELSAETRDELQVVTGDQDTGRALNGTSGLACDERSANSLKASAYSSRWSATRWLSIGPEPQRRSPAQGSLLTAIVDADLASAGRIVTGVGAGRVGVGRAERKAA